MLRWLENRLVYRPGRPTRDWIASGAEVGGEWEEVSFEAADGIPLSGWFFPARTDGPRAKLTLLFCHGNGGNISHRIDTYRTLLETGANLLAFDYRGYGRSAGKPGEEGTYRDAEAAHRWLEQRGFAGADIIAFGESLGGAVASELALRRPLGGLILQSTFTNIAEVGHELYSWLPVRWMHTIRYDTIAKLPHIKIPILVMHSRHDDIVRFRHGQRNFAAANEPKLFWELSGDHDYALGSDHLKCAEGMEKFLAMVESLEPA
jgi:uncharacterized protein